MTNEATLPHWDLTALFPGLDSPEFADAFDQVVSQIRSLEELFNRLGVRRRESPEVDPAWISAFEEATHHLNSLEDRRRTVGSYISCFVTTDARNDLARERESLLDTQSVPLQQLLTRYTAWVGSSDVEGLLEGSEVARRLEFQVRRARELEQHQMSEEEENLAAELRPSSINAWARLHGNVTALLAVSVDIRDATKMLPMSAVRSLANDPDRTVRKAAFEAEVKAWEQNATPLAAALNGVKGYQGLVRRRRGYDDDIEPTLMANSIDRQTLEAMQKACAESFPDFRRYMSAKAAALGVDRLAWYDLTAQVGAQSRSWSWPEAEAFIRQNFGRYSDRLASFADRTFKERWIDAEPRFGKEGGAYCTGIRPGESRIMLNYDGSFTSVSTLAHELGHAYHNLNMIKRLPMERRTPSTLAETASIFCETLCFEAAMEKASTEERIMLLDNTLQRDLMVVVDIHSRFLFEKAVFEKRAARDLTVTELNALMIEAQQATYGEELDPLHPYMWAVKGHYYGPTFYNYPYTFGLLFGLGLFSYYREHPDTFRQKYDDFLSSTGLADARSLGMQFGVDVAEVAFWRSSLDIIRGEIATFTSLVS